MISQIAVKQSFMFYGVERTPGPTCRVVICIPVYSCYSCKTDAILLANLQVTFWQYTFDMLRIMRYKMCWQSCTLYTCVCACVSQHAPGWLLSNFSTNPGMYMCPDVCICVQMYAHVSRCMHLCPPVICQHRFDSMMLQLIHTLRQSRVCLFGT